jgi:serine/threonine-protein kinase
MALPAPSIGQLLGRYRILEFIGAGGMGVVYRAHDEQLDRDVAIKVLPPGSFSNDSSRRRFRKEALVLAKLNHPHIATAYDFGTEGGLEFLVTEYIAGETLDSKLSHGALPPKLAIDLAIQLAQGLEAAHKENVSHRDLKPGNLRLNADGQLKILDFGLAQLVEPDTANALTATRTTQLPEGTLPYMAPEQLRAEPTDLRTDIWAAGAVIYEMATGRRPFPQAHGPNLIDAILNHEPPPPRTIHHEVTPALESIILKCLDKDPERRYQSARELRVDLVRMLPTSQLSGTNARLAHAVPGRHRSHRWAIVLPIILLVGALAGYFVNRKLATRAPQQRVLAVLPFDSKGESGSTTALVLGLTETLTARVAEVSDPGTLQLVSLREITSEKVNNPEAARREFGTDLVVEGSVHESGGKVRINCSLVDSRTHRQLSARSITADLNDAFQLEDEVVSEVLDMLQVGLQTPGKAARPEVAPDAYASYLRGLGYLQEYQKPENIDLAISEFQNAIKVDPKYAAAYAGLGQAFWRGYDQANHDKSWVEQASQNCRRALQLAPRLTEGHICSGNVYYGTGKYELAAAEFERAATGDPHQESALLGLADSYEKLHDNAAAEATYKKAIELRPRYWGVYSWLGSFYYRQARYEQAAEMFRKVIELAPDNYRGFSNLGATLVAQGRYPESIDILKRSIAIRPNLEAYNNLGNAYFSLRQFGESANAFQAGLKLDSQDWLLWGNLGDALYWTPQRRKESADAYRHAIDLAKQKLDVNPKDEYALAFVAGYYAMLDDRDHALEFLRKAIAVNPDSADVRFRAAIVYNHFGDANQTLDWLDKAIAAGVSPATVRDTRDFDDLRSNPRYQAMIKPASS